MVTDKTLLIFLFGFMVGVLARSFFDFSLFFALFALVLSGALYLVGKMQVSLFDRSRGGVMIALFIFSASVGMMRFDLSEFHTRDPILEKNTNQRVTVIGTVLDEPDERENALRLTVKLNALVQGDSHIPISGKTLVITDLYPRFQYGDRLEIRGFLERPTNFADPRGKVFDYKSFLAKEDIYYQLFRPSMKLLESGKGNFIIASLFKFKQAFLENIHTSIPEPNASLLGGLVVGAKQSLGKDLLDDFRKAGVIHIVVLSGYNITIVADAVIKFFSFLPRYFGQAFGAISIILFAIMTGGSATVVRASIMALLVILARNTSRQYNITRALLIAGFFMVLQNPKILVFDSSFQLSFMSTLALIYVGPLLEKHFLFVSEKWGLRSVVVATLATQIFVLPMLLYKMGDLSLVALPVNLLILLIIPATMLFGFLSGIFGFISTIIATPFAFVAYGFLEYELVVVEFFSNLPFATVAVGNFPFWLVVFVYLIYFLIYVRIRPKIVRSV